MLLKVVSYHRLKGNGKENGGIDLPCKEDVFLPSNSTTEVETGVRVAIPPGYVGLVKGRSGLAFHGRVTCFNGVIDSGYRGEIKVLLTTANTPKQLKAGERICQLVIVPCMEVIPFPVDELDNETERGEHGFGSTGR